MTMSMTSRPNPYQPPPPATYAPAPGPFNMTGNAGNPCDPDDWYSRSLNALRMPPSHGLGGPVLHYQ